MSIETPDKEIIALLLSIGLNKREARLYFIMLGKGEKNAEEMAKLTGIPTPHVYSIMKTLQRREIIEIIPEKTKKYRAIPLDLTINRLIDEKERTLLSLKKQSHEIAQKIKVDGKGTYTGELKPIIGLDAISKMVKEMLQGAKRDVLGITSPSMLLDHSEYFPFAINPRSRMVNVRILTQFGIEKNKRFKEFTDTGVEIKMSAQRHISHMLIVDESVLLIDVCFEEPLKPSDFGIWTNHKEIVTGKREKFEELWMGK